MATKIKCSRAAERTGPGRRSKDDHPAISVHPFGMRQSPRSRKRASRRRDRQVGCGASPSYVTDERSTYRLPQALLASTRD
jgi:hypothetical protein